jgi:hypothetical protein
VAVKVGDKKDYCHALKIHGSCQIVYQPHQPNRTQAGGARLWIEVEPGNIVERVYFSDGDYGPPPEVTEQRAKLKKNSSKVKKNNSKVKKNNSKVKRKKK